MQTTIEVSWEETKDKIIKHVQEVLQQDLGLVIRDNVKLWVRECLYDLEEEEIIAHIDSIMDIKEDLINECTDDIVWQLEKDTITYPKRYDNVPKNIK